MDDVATVPIHRNVILIWAFVAVSSVISLALVWWLSTGAITPWQATLLLIFISLEEVILTLAVWAYAAHAGSVARKPLVRLGEWIRRADLLLGLTTPLFDMIERISSKFIWDPVRKREWLETQIKVLTKERDRIDRDEEKVREARMESRKEVTFTKRKEEED